jgi:toxoflavin synthase
MDIENFEREHIHEQYFYLRENYSLKDLEDFSVLQTLGDLHNKTILDFGCGQGYYSRLLGKKAKKVVGIDVSKKMVRLANYYTNKKTLPNVDFYVRDGTETLDLNHFDVVFAAYTLSQAKNKQMLEKFVHSMYDSLKPGCYSYGIHSNFELNELQIEKSIKYGIMRIYPHRRETGSQSTIRFFDISKEDQPLVFEIDDYFIKSDDFVEVFRNVGFIEFEWINPFLTETHYNYEFFKDALEHPHFILFKAKKAFS